MLVTMGSILQKSREGKWGVIAPNVSNEDTARMAIQAAEENNTPVILNVLFHVNPDIYTFGKIMRDLAEHASVPVAINLDHGATFEHAVLAIQAGFTSIMVDRSSLPYEDNVREVRRLVEIAHAAGVTVEAELGHVGSGASYEADRDAGLTDPSQAKAYCEETGIDALAIAIGTAHGKYKGVPHIDFDLLKEIYDTVDVPLVLHGGSGSGDENLARVCREGITKINIGTDLYQAGLDNIVANATTMRRPHETFDYFNVSYKEKIVYYMNLFGQVGKGW